MKVGNVNALYLTNWSDNILQRTQHGGQGVDRDPHLRMDALLCGGSEGEEHLPWVLTVGPPDLGSSLGVRVTANPDQRPRCLCIDPRQR